MYAFIGYVGKKLLGDHGFKVEKNVPHKYLVKAPDSKASSKRYVDQNTHKIIDFPRNGSFEIYYLNILVFSKLQNGSFPDTALLVRIINSLRRSYQKNPLLSGFSQFRDLEMGWRKTEKLLDSVYGFVKLSYQHSPTNEELNCFFKKLERKKIIVNKENKQIYPYSFYAQREKQCKMEKIYCPRSGKKPLLSAKSTKELAPSLSVHKKERPPSGSTKKPLVNRRYLFRMLEDGRKKFETEETKLVAKVGREDYLKSLK